MMLLSGDVVVKKLAPAELHTLTRIYGYNDTDRMIRDNGREIERGALDVFVIFDGKRPIGELHASYEGEYAARGRRAYLFDFRVHGDFRGRGFGKTLALSVMKLLENDGYTEFIVGIEDNNYRAKHIFSTLGFTFLSHNNGETHSFYIKKV